MMTCWVAVDGVVRGRRSAGGVLVVKCPCHAHCNVIALQCCEVIVVIVPHMWSVCGSSNTA